MGRKMVLTPLAEDLVQPVRDVLQVQATIATKPHFEPSTSTRHFSIAVSDCVTSVLMVDFLRDILCQAPSATFELRPVGRRAAEDLESGKLNFLIAPESYVPTVHPKEVLFEDTHTCVAWSRNRKVGTTIVALNDILKRTVYRHDGEGGTIVVPGHGYVCDEHEVVEYRDMLVIVRDRVQAMVKKGATLDQVKAARVTAGYDTRYGAATGLWTMDMFVEAVYRDLSRRKQCRPSGLPRSSLKASTTIHPS